MNKAQELARIANGVREEAKDEVDEKVDEIVKEMTRIAKKGMSQYRFLVKPIIAESIKEKLRNLGFRVIPVDQDILYVKLPDVFKATL